jgi:hypothetical protein
VRTTLKRAGILFLAGALLAGTFTAMIPRRSHADTLSTAIIALFPKDAGEFAYADLKSARKFPWFAQLRDQVLPERFRQFEKFLATAGVDPNSQVEELAWAFIPGTDKTSEQMVGVALGTFNPSATEQAFKQRKLPVIDERGFHLYASSGADAGDIMFMFIDANTAAFGQRTALEHLLDVRAGLAENVTHNETLGPLITEANGSGLFWAAMNRAYTQLTLKQLLPQEASQFPQAAKIVDRIQSMFLDIHADSGIDTHFHAVCASPDDANVLAAALQAGVLYRKYQATQTNPDLANALDSVKITASGDRLTIEAPVSEDQITALLRKGTFAVKM